LILQPTILRIAEWKLLIARRIGEQPLQVVTRFVAEIDVQRAEARMNAGFGERGRNRTYNLLIFDQQPTNQWFQRFPKHFREYKQADLGKLFPSVLPSFEMLIFVLS
jgi:hypothetical protein